MNRQHDPSQLPALTGLQAGYVPVRQGARQTPLFVIQDQESVEAVFALVAERLDGDIPIYGLSVQAIEPPRPRTVEGIAARLVDTIRGVQPTGPYRLAGWSQGALVAYEVATQLVGQDQTVEFVGLVGEHVRCDLRAHAPVAAASLPVHLFVVDPVQKPQAPDTPEPVATQTAPQSAVAEPAEAVHSWRKLLPAAQVKEVKVPRAERGIHTPSRALGRALGEAIAESAGRPAQQSEAQYRPQLTIQSGSRGAAPLFCVPGAGDSVTGFTGLASALGPHWPVHGLQPRGVEGLMVPHATVQAAADSYLRAIELLQPTGPVHLVGHSFGGWIAFEIATRLRAANRQVASLTLIDSEAPEQGDVLGREHDALDVMATFVESLELASEKPLGVGRDALCMADPAQWLAMAHAGAVRTGIMPARSRPESLRGCLRTFGTALRTSYRPRADYTGPVRLVLIPDLRLDAAANQRQYQRMEEGWRRHAPQLSCWMGPGNHMTILKPPHVDQLARWWLAGLHAGLSSTTPTRDSVAAV